MVSKTNRVLTLLKKGGIATTNTNNFILPNNSGDHHKGIKINDPVNPTDLVNKNYVDRAYAGIHVHDNTTADTISTGTDYSKIQTFADDGVSLKCTADAANSRIIFQETGIYFLSCSINGQSGSNNVTFKFAPFVDGVEFDAIHMHRKFSSAGDKGSGAMTGLINITFAPSQIDIRARHDNGGAVQFTGTYMNFSVHKLGEII